MEGFSWFDALVVAICGLVLDLIGVLVVSGWQTAACGDSCGLRTQLHLMHVAAGWTLGVVVPLPLVVALLARKGRVVVAVLQGLLCLGLLLNTVSTEHRLVPRINGTAHCWNDLYSDADCPWGPKD
jgi:TRAP-type mannitol/chloroaromatic compound transport system permease large subunit